VHVYSCIFDATPCILGQFPKGTRSYFSATLGILPRTGDLFLIQIVPNRSLRNTKSMLEYEHATRSIFCPRKWALVFVVHFLLNWSYCSCRRPNSCVVKTQRTWNWL